jgi:hypothetical protein
MVLDATIDNSFSEAKVSEKYELLWIILASVVPNVAQG